MSTGSCSHATTFCRLNSWKSSTLTIFKHRPKPNRSRRPQNSKEPPQILRTNGQVSLTPSLTLLLLLLFFVVVVVFVTAIVLRSSSGAASFDFGVRRCRLTSLVVYLRLLVLLHFLFLLSLASLLLFYFFGLVVVVFIVFVLTRLFFVLFAFVLASSARDFRMTSSL